MAAQRNHKAMVNKVKKQIDALHKKEEMTRNKLRSALMKVNRKMLSSCGGCRKEG